MSSAYSAQRRVQHEWEECWRSEAHCTAPDVARTLLPFPTSPKDGCSGKAATSRRDSGDRVWCFARERTSTPVEVTATEMRLGEARRRRRTAPVARRGLGPDCAARAEQRPITPELSEVPDVPERAPPRYLRHGRIWTYLDASGRTCALHAPALSAATIPMRTCYPLSMMGECEGREGGWAWRCLQH